MNQETLEKSRSDQRIIWSRFCLMTKRMILLQMLKKLEDSTKNSGFDFEYIHTGPVIRREDVFFGLSIDERRKLLFKMLNFIVSSPIAYEMAVVNRKEAPDKISLSGELGREISNVIENIRRFLMNSTKLLYTTIIVKSNLVQF